MKNNIKVIALTSMMAASLALVACEDMGNKQMMGTGGGALLGGLLGSLAGKGTGRLWMTGAGVLLGALAGSEIGKSLDKADQAYANQANQQASSAPIGQSIKWNNPQSGNYGTITPTRDGYSTNGRYCREYQQTVVVGGKQQSAYGTACQQPDGSWQVTN